jgi:hypothetical protein
MLSFVKSKQQHHRCHTVSLHRGAPNLADNECSVRHPQGITARSGYQRPDPFITYLPQSPGLRTEINWNTAESTTCYSDNLISGADSFIF